MNSGRGVTVKELAEVYPRLYHMAHEQAWESIRKYGLLSTTSILDLWGTDTRQRHEIESEIRKTSVELFHPRQGKAVIRDQKPMHEGKLSRALIDCTVQEWCRLLNGRVFFWPNPERLSRHMAARENRGKRQLVLTVDTYRLLSAYKKSVTLCAMNSGNTIPFAKKRGRKSLMPMTEYPFHERLRRGRHSTVAEIAVEGGVPDITDFTVSVDFMMYEGDRIRQLETIASAVE